MPKSKERINGTASFLCEENSTLTNANVNKGHRQIEDSVHPIWN